MTVDTLGRALQLYRRTATTRSAVLLIVANLIPLVGVVFFGWSLWTILVLYWVENGIVGFWNVPKILLAQGSVLPTVVPPIPDDAALAATGWDPAKAAKLRASWDEARAAQQRALDAANAANAASAASTASAANASNAANAANAASPAEAAAGPDPDRGPLDVNPLLGRIRVFGQPVASGAGRTAMAVFFCMHYGIFWFVHGIFVFTLPMFLGGDAFQPGCGGPVPELDPGAVLNPDLAGVCGSPFGEIVWSNVLLGAVVLFLSHGASFLFNYLGRAEYLTTSPVRQTAAPYGRVVVLHLTIIFGAFAVALLGAPIGALLVLIGAKTALDLGLHLRERHAADARIPADTAYGTAIRGS